MSEKKTKETKKTPTGSVSDDEAYLLSKVVRRLGWRTPLVPTVGEIARRLGVAVHRVEYVIRARRVRPSGWAGNARVFTEADVDRIRSELRRIDAEKGGSHAHNC